MLLIKLSLLKPRSTNPNGAGLLMGCFGYQGIPLLLFKIEISYATSFTFYINIASGKVFQKICESTTVPL